MPSTNGTQVDGAATGRTIEDIEARAVAVREAERDAMGRLADHLRELAVELPTESKLPLRFAAAARAIELFRMGSDPTVVANHDLPWLVEEWGLDACTELVDKLRIAGIVRR